jgi:hypothetical protein
MNIDVYVCEYVCIYRLILCVAHPKYARETNSAKVKKKATAECGINVRVRMLTWRTAGYKSLRIRKVLRLANSTKAFMGFLSPRSIPKFRVVLDAVG